MNAQTCTPEWRFGAGQGLPGTDNTVSAAMLWDSDGPGPLPERLTVGGSFRHAGTADAHKIAVWNGESWSPVGSGLATGSASSSVSMMRLFQGELVVGGSFADAGPGLLDYLARWDGAAWQPLGTGVSSAPAAMMAHNGSLIVGGDFTSAGGVSVNRIARWDGSTWHAMGSGLTHPSPTMTNFVYGMALYGPDLIVVGRFDTAGGVTNSFIAKWDGASWVNVPVVFNNYVTSVGARGPELFVGGTFSGISGFPIPGLARFDGAGWGALGSGVTGGVVGFHPYGPDTILTGSFTAVGGAPANHLARWNGAVLQPITNPLTNPQPNAPVTVAAVEHDGALFVVGRFARAGPAYARNAVRWLGSQWSPLGQGLGEPTNYVASFQGKLIADAGLLAWDGAAWSPLIPANSGTASFVKTAIEHEGDLVFAGFLTVPGPPSNELQGVIRGQGASWQPVGPEFPVPNALCAYNGDLIAGGPFSSIAGQTMNSIARWDGIQWAPLATGVTMGSPSNQLDALTVYNGELIAAGRFGLAGGVAAKNVARWDGVQWRSLGTTTALGDLYAAAVFNGELYVGGRSTTIGGQALSVITRWNGTVWSPVGAGLQGTFATGTAWQLNALLPYNGELYAAGNIRLSGTTATNGIARWNGTTWQSMGVGMDQPVNDLTIHDGELVAGGGFTSADGQNSWYWARWGCEACYPDCNASGSLTVADFGCFQSKYVLADPYADCNASGSLTVADFGCFQGKYVLGCP